MTMAVAKMAAEPRTSSEPWSTPAISALRTTQGPAKPISNGCISQDRSWMRALTPVSIRAARDMNAMPRSVLGAQSKIVRNLKRGRLMKVRVTVPTPVSDRWVDCHFDPGGCLP